MAAIADTWRRVAHNDQLLLFCLAVVVGTAAGYGALGFRLLTAAIQAVVLGDGHENVATIAAALPWWWLLAAPTLGGLRSVRGQQRDGRRRRGSMVPQAVGPGGAAAQSPAACNALSRPAP